MALTWHVHGNLEHVLDCLEHVLNCLEHVLDYRLLSHMKPIWDIHQERTGTWRRQKTTFMNNIQDYTRRTRKNTVREWTGEADLEHASRTQVHEEHRRYIHELHWSIHIKNTKEYSETVRGWSRFRTYIKNTDTWRTQKNAFCVLHLWEHRVTWDSRLLKTIENMTVSTENATSPKAPNSRFSDFLISRGTISNWGCSSIRICSKEFNLSCWIWRISAV